MNAPDGEFETNALLDLDQEDHSCSRTLQQYLISLFSSPYFHFPANLEFLYQKSFTRFLQVAIPITAILSCLAFYFGDVIIFIVLGFIDPSYRTEERLSFQLRHFINAVVLVAIAVPTSLLMASGLIQRCGCRRRLVIYPAIGAQQSSSSRSRHSSSSSALSRFLSHPSVVQVFLFVCFGTSAVAICVVRYDPSRAISLLAVISVLPGVPLLLFALILGLLLVDGIFMDMFFMGPALFPDNPTGQRLVILRNALVLVFAADTLSSVAYFIRLVFRKLFFLRYVTSCDENRLSREEKKNELILSNILPPAIRTKLEKEKENVFSVVSSAGLLFVTIDGFFELTTVCSPLKLVSFLNVVFSRLDNLVELHGAYRVKTVNEKYFIGVGLFDNNDDDVIERSLTEGFRLALDILYHVVLASPSQQTTLGNASSSSTLLSKLIIKLRIGLNCGKSVVGMIGNYDNPTSLDVFSDAVNTSSRLCDAAEPSSVAMKSEAFASLPEDLRRAHQANIIMTSKELKGKGDVDVTCVVVTPEMMGSSPTTSGEDVSLRQRRKRQMKKKNRLRREYENGGSTIGSGSTHLVEQILLLDEAQQGQRTQDQKENEAFITKMRKSQNADSKSLSRVLEDFAKSKNIDLWSDKDADEKVFEEISRVKFNPLTFYFNDWGLSRAFERESAHFRVGSNRSMILYASLMTIFIAPELFPMSLGLCLESVSWLEILLTRYAPFAFMLVVILLPIASPVYKIPFVFQFFSVIWILFLAVHFTVILITAAKNCPPESYSTSILLSNNLDDLISPLRILFIVVATIGGIPIHLKILSEFLVLSGFILGVSVSLNPLSLFWDMNTWLLFLISLGIMGVMDVFEKKLFLNKLVGLAKRKLIKKEKDRTTKWLLSYLPKRLYDRVFDPARFRKKGAFFSKFYEDVACFYSDIVGFTAWAARLQDPRSLMIHLNRIFSSLDEIAQRNDIVRVKFVGDCGHYISSLKSRDEKEAERRNHVLRMLDFSCDFIEFLSMDDADVQMRIGIHLASEVIGALVGTQRFQFSVFGGQDVFAEVLESTSPPMKIHVSEEMREAAIERLDVLTEEEEEEEGEVVVFEGLDVIRLRDVVGAKKKIKKRGRSTQQHDNVFVFEKREKMVEHYRLPYPVQTYLFHRIKV